MTVLRRLHGASHVLGCVRALALSLVFAFPALADQPPAPWQEAEVIRLESTRIERLMLRKPSDPARDEITGRLGRLEAAWAAACPAYGAACADAGAALPAYAAAVRAGDGPAAARARQLFWAGLTGAAGQRALDAIAAGDAVAAEGWLHIRDYARTTGDTTATRAIAGLVAGSMTREEAAAAVSGELLTVAASELRLALREARAHARAGHATLLAGDLGRAEGMARILSANLAERLGEEGRDALMADLARAVAGDAGAIDAAEARLATYAPVALAADEVMRRARLMRRFTVLIQFDYQNGVRGGEISNALEYREAVTFRARAALILGEVAPGMPAREDATRLASLYAQMETLIAARGEPDTLRPLTDEALARIDRNFGAEVAQGGYALAVESLPVALEAIATAAREGDWLAAEAARLEAYAWFDPDIEQRLVPRAPALALRLEAMFWEGSAARPGLGRLVETRAAPEAIADETAMLLATLDEARALIETPFSFAGAAVQSAGILFREGLEAVLILAALLAALRAEGGDPSRYRGAIGLGAGGAVLASVALWGAARWLIAISTLAREAIEGGTALLAALVLIWLTLGLAAHGGQVAALRRRLAAGVSAGGLAVLAFFVVFREGFETILFYEALLVDAPQLAVLAGLVAGACAVALIAWAVLAAGRRLPLRALFRVTGVLLGVLAVMLTGAGIRGLQTAALMGATPVSWFPENYHLQLWLGLYPVAESLAAQALVIAVFVLAWALRRWRAPAARIGQRPG